MAGWWDAFCLWPDRSAAPALHPQPRPGHVYGVSWQWELQFPGTAGQDKQLTVERCRVGTGTERAGGPPPSSPSAGAAWPVLLNSFYCSRTRFSARGWSQVLFRKSWWADGSVRASCVWNLLVGHSWSALLFLGVQRSRCSRGAGLPWSSLGIRMEGERWAAGGQGHWSLLWPAPLQWGWTQGGCGLHLKKVIPSFSPASTLGTSRQPHRNSQNRSALSIAVLLLKKVL